jgi:hypothetical protein
MSLLDVRTRFKAECGRPSMSDSDANWYIDAGRQELDRRLLSSYYTNFRHIVALPASGFGFSLSGTFDVAGVSYRDSDNAIVELEYKPLLELRALYPEWEDTAAGSPLYWTYYPQTFSDDDSSAEALSRAQAALLKCVVMPPTEDAIDLEVFARVGSHGLVLDDDENYWTLSNPDVLVYAALFKLSEAYQNREKTDYWNKILSEKVMQLDQMQVLKELSEGGVMNG